MNLAAEITPRGNASDARLLVRIPAARSAERRYIVGQLLGRFLGQSVDVCAWGEGYSTITCVDGPGMVVVPDNLLAVPPKAWLTAASLPGEPVAWLDAAAFLGRHGLPFQRLPAIFPPALGASPTPAVSSSGPCITIPMDLFGSAFFMLTRYEELVSQDRDVHGRFPAEASLAYRQGFLDAPVVNQYAEVLWAALLRLWPRLQRSRRSYSLWVSHDVDLPFLSYRRSRGRLLAGGLKQCAGDLITRRSARLATRRAGAIATTLARGALGDPHYNFETVMDLDEACGQRATYFFLATGPGPFAPTYGIDEPEMRAVLRAVAQRGHSVGLHASYASAEDAGALRLEWRALLAACEAEGVRQESWGSRCHYLRWSAAEGIRRADSVGIDYDSTLAYAGRAGFRCGTCYEYATFDLAQGRPLRLVERPLIAMESSIIDPQYMGMGLTEAAFDAFTDLAVECRKYEGTYALLWHNHRLVSEGEVELYKALLEAC